MFASALPTGSVCLRCQLRLASAATGRRALSAAAPLLENRSRPGRANDAREWRQELGDGAAELEDARADPRGDEHGSSRHAPDDAPGPVRRVDAEASRPRKLYTSKGSRLRVEAEKLRVDTLGKPSEAIVFRDAGPRTRWPAAAEELPPAEAEPVDVLGSLEREGRSPQPDEVMQNIQELRPRQGVLTEREYMAVFDTLLHGFTGLQLEAYVARHRAAAAGAHEAPEGLPEAAAAPPWVVRQWKWMPEIEDADEEVDYLLRGYVLNSMTPKEKLVARVMRGCWGLSIYELMDRHGRLDVQARDPEFSLLALGHQQWLQTISRATLEPGKQIELLRSQRLIRIVAPKATAETILAEIDSILRTVKSRSFDAGLVAAEHPLDPAVLREAGNIADAIVQYDDAKTEIQVTWIDARNSNPDHESVADTVLRLLMTAYPAHPPSSRVTAQGDAQRGKLQTQYGGMEKLAWKDRLTAWGRLLYGRTRAAAGPAAGLQTAGVLAHDLDLVLAREVAEGHKMLDWLASKPAEDDAKPAEEGGERTPPAGPDSDAPPVPARTFQPVEAASWSAHIYTSTRAVFGHVLHPVPGRAGAGAGAGQQLSPFAPSLLGPSGPRVLLPVTPPLAEGGLELKPWHAASYILLRFLPLPARDSPPPLELRLAIKEATKSAGPYVAGISSLRALLGPASARDVLLPSGPVDARTLQARYAELPWLNREAAPGTHPLLPFLQRSALELESGSLAMPARLPGMGIPRRLLQPPPPPSSPPSPAGGDGAAAAAANDDADLVQVDYVFAGLELCRTVEATYQGWRLAYTSVEAGRGGGRRAELSLEAVPGLDAARGRAPEDTTADAFMGSVYQLASGREGIAWLGEGQSM